MADLTPTPSRRDREARNARIAAARANGEGWDAIAAREGVSVRQAARAREEHLRLAAETDVLDVDPERVLGRILAAHETALAALEALVSAADNDSARVGAARALCGVATSWMGVLERAGALPSGVRGWSMARDIATVGDVMVRAAVRSGVPEGVYKAAMVEEAKACGILSGPIEAAAR